MININRNNYEEYFIDFLDGNLKQTEREQLFLFLDTNPDLKKELESFDGGLVMEGEVSYENKSILLKKSLLAEVTSTNFDELCIASLEGELNQAEEKYFQELIHEDPKKRKEFEVFKLTKFPREEAIVFKHKHVLKKIAKPRFKWNYAIISTAASIVILMGIYFLLPKQKTPLIEKPIAEIKDQLKSISENKITEKENIEKVEPINIYLSTDNKIINKVKIDILKENNLIDNKQSEITENRYGDIDKLVALNVPFDEGSKINSIELRQTNRSVYIMKTKSSGEEKYFTVGSFLASRVFNRRENEKLEWFDVAQASVEGINKLTGSSMSLERKYDENGNPDKTEFNSKLIAFSTPSKKD